jgi:hypothetical protein
VARDAGKATAFSASRMDNSDKFWFGDFPSSGDINVSGSATRTSCADPGNIGMVNPACDFQGGGSCDVCSGTSRVHLQLHVNLPPAPSPSSPGPAPPPGTDPCAALASCCPRLPAIAGPLQMACTLMASKNIPAGCAQVLDVLRGKSFCP